MSAARAIRYSDATPIVTAAGVGERWKISFSFGADFRIQELNK
jgi:hypothetical protein